MKAGDLGSKQAPCFTVQRDQSPVRSSRDILPFIPCGKCFLQIPTSFGLMSNRQLKKSTHLSNHFKSLKIRRRQRRLVRPWQSGVPMGAQGGGAVANPAGHGRCGHALSRTSWGVFCAFAFLLSILSGDAWTLCTLQRFTVSCLLINVSF